VLRLPEKGRGVFVRRFKCGDVFSRRPVNYVGRMAPHNQARDPLTLEEFWSFWSHHISRIWTK
jgi:hypothetical protein